MSIRHFLPKNCKNAYAWWFLHTPVLTSIECVELSALILSSFSGWQEGCTNLFVLFGMSRAIHKKYSSNSFIIHKRLFDDLRRESVSITLCKRLDDKSIFQDSWQRFCIWNGLTAFCSYFGNSRYRKIAYYCDKNVPRTHSDGCYLSVNLFAYYQLVPLHSCKEWRQREEDMIPSFKH